MAEHVVAARSPDVGRDPGWVLELDTSDAADARHHGSLLALCDGTVGVRGDLEDRDTAAAARLVLCPGAYGVAADGLVRPLAGPTWTDLSDGGRPASTVRRTLDLRTGVVTRHPSADRGLGSVRFVSIARPGTMAMRAIDTDRGTRPWPDPLGAPAPDPLAAPYHLRQGTRRGGWWASTVSNGGAVTVAAVQRPTPSNGAPGIERFVAVTPGRGRRRATEAAEAAAAVGFEALLTEQRRAWAERWASADVEIVGDDNAQLAVRFALFHLLSAAATAGEAAVGARGATGLAYAGHVFWDTDVFVLPALAATLPDAARAVLEYRIRRLPAARARAAETGHRGARFPWESAATGDDVTPRSYRSPEGRTVAILTGELEEHIVADVAWAALHYLDWTGDTSLLAGDGRWLVTEGAEYWADRIRLGTDGSGHIDGVIGPDEYHEHVDDNAFTNLMARWHLRRAAELAEDVDEAARWRTLADALVDGYDHGTRTHEQFRGYSALRPVMIAELAEPPVAADLLLGPDRIARTQVIKQPDVLMAHHLIPDELAEGSLAADLDRYLPRTAHGSSLSPAICAALLARVGRPDDAMDLFDLACRLDLDDLTSTTAGGLHVATMGGVWQAVVGGFAGVRATREALHVDPHLPSRWSRLSVRVRFRGRRVVVTVEPDAVTVEAAGDVPVVVGGARAQVPCRVPIRPDDRSDR
ncbi:MAG: glycosyl hydrolase family 65 protein [Actinomycetota bacterium]|nr:glycosyl hydrolase family 65 protein [Actinomycetota bacterium]